MKIGILTLQGASNYGAVLQVLGLMNTSSRKGTRLRLSITIRPKFTVITITVYSASQSRCALL